MACVVVSNKVGRHQSGKKKGQIKKGVRLTKKGKLVVCKG